MSEVPGTSQRTQDHRAIPGVGSLIAIEDAEGNVYFYHMDPLGGIHRLTDIAQAIAKLYEFGPFGRMLQETGSAPNQFVFPGTYLRCSDVDGLGLSPTRTHNTCTGRFLQRELRRALGGDYVYVLGNPVVLTDGSGLRADAGCCGLDISYRLERLLQHVDDAWHHGTLRATEKRALVCSNLVTPPMATYAWDIVELYKYDRLKEEGQLGKPRVPSGRDCEGTVVVDDVCWPAGAVNYVFYGHMMRLCHEFYRSRPFTSGVRAFLGSVGLRHLETEMQAKHSMLGMLLLLDLYKGESPTAKLWEGMRREGMQVLPGPGPQVGVDPGPFRTSPNYEACRAWAVAGYQGWPARRPEEVGTKSCYTKHGRERRHALQARLFLYTNPLALNAIYILLYGSEGVPVWERIEG